MGGKIAELNPLLLPFLVYPIVTALVLRLRGRTMWRAFAVSNTLFALAATGATLVPLDSLRRTFWINFVAFGGPMFLLYVLFVLTNYVLLSKTRTSLAPFLFPIVFLILVKYFPPVDTPFLGLLSHFGVRHLWVFLIGISYSSFRLTHLVSEVRNGVISMPSLSEYVAFAFFVPVMFVGPITPYSLFRKSFEEPSPPRRLRAVTRILVGLVKYVFLSAVLSQLTYSGLMLDGHPHVALDLVVAILVYPLFLYFNFSGLCDVAIGVSGLLGIEVMENFDRPFSSRNFQEFWSRWHISLSSWFRDMMFTPMVKSLTRKVGAKNVNHAIAITIVSVFVVLGVWHGAGWNFFLYGLTQGLGVVTVHYSTLYLRKRLGKEGFAKYRANKTYYVLGVVATYLYFALTMILFANTLEGIGAIFKAIV